MDDFRIPLCVPWWDEREVLNLNAKYDEAFGFYIDDAFLIDEFYQWVPYAYRGEGSPVLIPEMLPVTSWENNVRTSVTKDHWNKLRKYCYQAAGHRCEICGKKGSPYIESHELWSFHQKNGKNIQKLDRLIALCQLCHKGYHLGYAKRLGIYDAVVKNLMWVNDWNEQQLKEGLDKAWEMWRERSKEQWELDISWLFSPEGYRYV